MFNILLIIIYFFILLFCFKWVASTVLSLPADLAHLKMLRAEEKMDIFWPELTTMLFYWVVSLVLVAIVFIPLVFGAINGWGKIVELIQGFSFLF